MMASIIWTGSRTSMMINFRAYPTQGNPGENVEKTKSNYRHAAGFELFHLIHIKEAMPSKLQIVIHQGYRLDASEWL